MWWILVVADRGHSIRYVLVRRSPIYSTDDDCSYGRPYNIFQRHCDVQRPANIDDEDLTANGPVNIKPDAEITHYTATICYIKMSKVTAEIIDRAFSCTTPSEA